MGPIPRGWSHYVRQRPALLQPGGEVARWPGGERGSGDLPGFCRIRGGVRARRRRHRGRYARHGHCKGWLSKVHVRAWSGATGARHPLCGGLQRVTLRGARGESLAGESLAGAGVLVGFSRREGRTGRGGHTHMHARTHAHRHTYRQTPLHTEANSKALVGTGR